MAVDLDNLLQPTDTDPIGSPSNGIQVEMRAVKGRLKTAHQKLIVPGAYPQIAATFYNQTTAPNSPVILLSGYNLADLTYLGGVYTATALENFTSSQILAFNAGIVEAGSASIGEAVKIYQARIFNVTTNSFQFHFYRDGAALRAATFAAPAWFSVQFRAGI